MSTSGEAIQGWRDKNHTQQNQVTAPSPDPISAYYISTVLAAVQGALNLSRIELYSIMFIVLSAEAILPRSVIQFIACNHVTLLKVFVLSLQPQD